MSALRAILVALAFACFMQVAAQADESSTVQIVTSSGMTVAQGDDIASRPSQTHFAFEWARSPDGSLQVSMPGYIMVSPTGRPMRLDGRAAEQLRTGTMPSHGAVSVSAGQVNAATLTRMAALAANRGSPLTLIVAQYN